MGIKYVIGVFPVAALSVAAAGCAHPRSGDGGGPSLAAKAAFFEAEIEARHRRTPYGFVNSVFLDRPGDRSSWRQNPSDNDGLWTAQYGAAQCYAYAATRDPAARARARAAFEALRFLTEVTQGGPHPAPRGFPARSVVSADEDDPNATWDTPERHLAKRARDPLWKLIHPRWPVSADGRWRWKCDTSSDELDGHFFFYARYHDLAAETAPERARVRETVRAIIDHLIDHDFRLVDWDGTPTRWANFNPESLNRDPAWAEERGLNSLSLLSYLAVAGHVTGDARYLEVARDLIDRHGYARNVELLGRVGEGPERGNQSDDELAFMGFHNLLKYERDPELRRRYREAFRACWERQRPEGNPFFHYLYATAAPGGPPGGAWRGEALETLKRFPVNRLRWGYVHSRRGDVRVFPGEGSPRGGLRDGRVLSIDERWVNHWNADPWALNNAGDGRELADGTAFLLPYYMGRWHGFVGR